MELEKIIFILVGVVVTTAFQFISTLLTKTSDKTLKHKGQLKLLLSELEDLIRHCIANLQVLRSMDLEKGIPSDLHFEKMKVMESSVLFSADTFLIINSQYTRYVNRIKLEIRNINLEIDYLLTYKRKANFELPILEKYIGYLVSKMEITINNLPQRLAELTDIDETVLERIKNHKEENEKTARTIIYE